jgi:hypothetical protein
MNFMVIPARYACNPETARKQVSTSEEQTRGEEVQMETSSITVDALRQLGVVLLKSSRLV